LVCDGRFSMVRRSLGTVDLRTSSSYGAILTVRADNLTGDNFACIFVGVGPPVLLYRVDGRTRIFFDLPLGQRHREQEASVSFVMRIDTGCPLTSTMRSPASLNEEQYDIYRYARHG
jgi:2-polyprenyl-6-methoxyphenol hydroxylase-like FAD-dependent oxidoreductase